METLNSENLISGAIDAEEQETCGLEPVNDAPTAETPPDPVPEASSPDEELIKRIVDASCERFADKLLEAEERGFNRALELSQRSQSSRSVPNFLADVRPDVWS